MGFLRTVATRSRVLPLRGPWHLHFPATWWPLPPAPHGTPGQPWGTLNFPPTISVWLTVSLIQNNKVMLSHSSVVK